MSASRTSSEFIRIRGARVHNLQNVDLDIPRDCLVVITGPSGSGKSSLALDTVFAEGRRQYIETLSVYSRQFFRELTRPDVDSVEGLAPTVCIDQRAGNQNPRSTVATMTETYHYLRLLMARLGQPCCYRCGTEIRQQTPDQIIDALLQLPERTKMMILAPLVRGRRGAHQQVMAKIRKAGLVRCRIDGRIYDIDQVPDLSARHTHHIEAVVDRIIIRPGVLPRLRESVDLAVRFGEGLVTVCVRRQDREEAGWDDLAFSTRHACPACGLSYIELEPRTFSFNSPYGACPECEGIGSLVQFDPTLVIPDPQRSLATGAILPWRNLPAARERKLRAELGAWVDGPDSQLTWETPLSDLGPQAWKSLLWGQENPDGFLGVLIMLEKELATATNPERQRALEAFRGEVRCAACQGSRLRAEANHVFLADKSIADITAMAVTDAHQFFQSLEFPTPDGAVADPLTREILHRLSFLQRVGLGYLTLDRPADTLSGGELQRVRLATSIGSGLVGVCFVLDEPSIGLHPRDNHRLIDAILHLRDEGNTVLVVEHDELIMRRADYLIDVGPGAGKQGGRIVSAGLPDQVSHDEDSITGRYLRGVQSIPIPSRRRRIAKSRSLKITGATTNNLQSVDAVFPLQALVCVTGVSGSGKSSLVNDTLTRALVRKLGGIAPAAGAHVSLRGSSQIDKVVEINQTPIGRTPRSTPATYTGLFDEVRKVFAASRDAKRMGYRAGRFSFNSKAGQCESCQGFGITKIEMNFLPNIHVTCDQCGGARFNQQTLAIRFRGHSIADVLSMSVNEAADFFESFVVISRPLECLKAVGLGYLPLGQSSTTLSGGEAQRIKLATQLARPDTGQTLYLLDEPTTGLHFDDIRKMLDVLGQLVDRGNSVIVIEHNLDVIKTADWILDLGPEGGELGGQIIATGTPEEIAQLDHSHTGRFLREVLNRSGDSDTANQMPSGFDASPDTD